MDLSNINNALIVAIIPYFLEKENAWVKENKKEILESRKLQSFFEDNTLYLTKNNTFNLSETLRKLDQLGYEKVLQVTDPGEFSQRGGTLDVFPINLTFALRFEFLGNKIENIEKLPIEIENEKTVKELLKKKLKSQKLFSDLKGLKPGDYLTHLDHGIGKFIGYYKDSNDLNYYLLEYAQNDKLYIPIGLERKLSYYVGFQDPKVSRLASLTWQKTKRKVKEEAEKLAKELLAIHANRTLATRPPYSDSNEIDLQVAYDFKYEETPDQLEALKDIAGDLKKDKPMDRIICGDVGFGKTEVALRTMIKAVNSGYQVVMICPTTILANQHFQNFKERLKNIPINLSLLSRLQNKKEQKEIIENIKEGKTDFIVATHRILSKDIVFKNLGLLIIDDEQRFGVKQKEKLKQLRSSLDILSLSATPIPRTLYMALSSLKAISTIQTPPSGRLAVKTFITPFSEKTIKEAITYELDRQGQIYYLHNRIETIEAAKKFLTELLKDKKNVNISIIHGRLKEKELVKAMQDFKEKKSNILIATTIIESGLDLANANTLIVADATRLGLAEAYQIRGRVGRSHQQAFAYFLHGKKLTPLAKLRLKALKEAQELGSGYRIALKDLEIRGAGNILGKEQSGSINKVGLNLYCQILNEAIEKLRSNS